MITSIGKSITFIGRSVCLSCPAGPLHYVSLTPKMFYVGLPEANKFTFQHRAVGVLHSLHPRMRAGPNNQLTLRCKKCIKRMNKNSRLKTNVGVKITRPRTW